MSQYEESPRGRIVYNSDSKRFMHYADAQILRRPGLSTTIHETFRLPTDRTEAKRDNHYRSTRRLEG
jgi:hypothetical protein